MLTQNTDGISFANGAQIGLNDLIYDEAEYYFCSPSTSWIIKEIWLWDGLNGEEKEDYYMNSTESSQAYMIELYNMVLQRPVDIQKGKVTNSHIALILNFHGGCHVNAGQCKTVNLAKTRPSSP